MTCDHEKCGTKFCPHCGMTIGHSPATLLADLRTKQAAQEKRASTLRRRPDYKYPKDIAAADRQAAKFKAWADYVESTMKDSK